MVGGCGEAIVAAEFLKRGIPVYRPIVDNGADLVVDIGGELKRVQVKSSISTDRRVIFHLGRRNPNREAGAECWLAYDHEAVDWYALCCIGHNFTALVRPDKSTKRLTFGHDERLSDIEIGAVIERELEENK